MTSNTIETSPISPKQTPANVKSSDHFLPLALMTEVTGSNSNSNSIKSYRLADELSGVANYMYWASKMSDLFYAYGQWNENTQCPTDSVGNAFAITSNVSRECYDLLRDTKLASKQWQILKVRFGGVSVSMQIKVIKQLSAFTYGTDALSSFNTGHVHVKNRDLDTSYDAFSFM